MEGEDIPSDNERAFNKTSIIKRIAIVAAGATVNILFGIILYFLLAMMIYSNWIDCFKALGDFFIALFQSIKLLFTGNIGVNDLAGPIGISKMVSSTVGIKEYLYMLSIISVSLGITNLLPIPALDGGKIVLLIIEKIRKKPLKENTEIFLQLVGFSILIFLSIFVAYNDLIRIGTGGVAI